MRLDYLAFSDWYHQSLVEIVRQFEAERLPARWLRDLWAPHNILFGMQLGYPGVAICSGCDLELTSQRLKTIPDDSYAVNFNYPSNEGTDVNYTVQRSDRSDRQILEHAELRQAYFDEVYESWGSFMRAGPSLTDAA